MPERRASAQLLAAAALLLTLACDAAVDRVVLSMWDTGDASLLDDGSLHVVLCGTGAAVPDPGRLPACTAILAGGEFVLVDTGPGTILQADLLELPLRHLSALLITHFHSDHIGGLGQTLSHTWLRGRKKPVRIYGPPGIERVMRGFAEAYAFDTEYRALPLGDELDPRWQVPEVHELALDEAPTPVFERNGLRVTAFAVDHSPVQTALGYRIDYHGRSVVLSGDTRAYPPLARHARGADLLIHSAGGFVGFLVESIERLGERGEMPRVDPALFATPVEVAGIAAEAGVGTLVFSHIPPITNALFRRVWLRGVSDVFDGEVVVGEDGMRFALEAREAGD